jgi:hypothetical protein
MKCSDVIYTVIENKLRKEKAGDIASKYNFSAENIYSDPASYFLANPNKTVDECWKIVKANAATSLD